MNRISAYLIGLLHAFIGGEKLVANAVAGLEKLTAKLDAAATQIGTEVDKSFQVTDELSRQMSAEYDRREALYMAQDRATRVKYNVEKLLGVSDADENDPFEF